ncbi:MAG: galactose-1-phosphate uridylyltransferase [Nocardioidaceae bacterium]
MALTKTSIRLADGRDLLYFDEHSDADRTRADERELGPGATGSELRYDPLLDEWVAVASHRQDRTFLPPSDACPLCPSRPGHPTEVPATEYDVVVFENRFPSFAMHAPEPEHATPATGQLFARRAGIGRCEVVCFTSDHQSSFASLTPERTRTVVEAWADRTAELGRLDGIEQVFCFENRGEEIGVTLGHPHGQIYGYPFVTPRTARMLASAHAHAERTGGGNLFDDLVAAERAAGTRIVAETEHWIAFVPAAARWPVEVHLYPRRRVPDLPALSDAERDDFGPVYLRVLRALDRYFDMPLPYIAGWHQAPVSSDRELSALHLQVFSIRRAPNKLKYLAGSESGMGVWINDVRPEQIAERIRELL